jgi:hypothetical protein
MNCFQIELLSGCPCNFDVLPYSALAQEHMKNHPELRAKLITLMGGGPGGGMVSDF